MSKIRRTSIHAFNDPLTSTNSSVRTDKLQPSKTSYTTLTILGSIVLIVLLAAAVVVPIVYALNTSTSVTTTVRTTTVTTATTTTTTTVTTSSTTSTTTTTTALPIQWNSTGVTVAGSAAGVSGVTASLMSITYSLALDASNAIYITDYANNRIQKWMAGASNGTTVAGLANGTAGASSTALQVPVGIVLDSSNNMYFTDRANHRVMYWANGASSGTVIAGITGSAGSAATQLNSPSGLVRNATNGDLYIADTTNHRIVYWPSGASSGTVVAGGNGAGSGSTQLFAPYSLAFDAVTNSLIIVNYSAHNVVRWILGATSWTLLAGVTGTSGSTSTLLNNPLSIVFDPYGNLYVSDTQNHRIQFFPAGQSNGTTIAGTTGSLGTGANQLRLPYWAIIDNQFNLYVADTYNHRIQKFSRY